MHRYFNYKTSICETRKDSCVEYDDKEFIYKLCPFGSISKISKANQKSISLGQYGSNWEFDSGDRCYKPPSYWGSTGSWVLTILSGIIQVPSTYMSQKQI